MTNEEKTKLIEECTDIILENIDNHIKSSLKELSGSIKQLEQIYNNSLKALKELEKDLNYALINNLRKSIVKNTIEIKLEEYNDRN